MNTTNLRPWDGKWSVPKPADYLPGLYRVHQIDAFHLLKTARGLDEWAATFLQTVAYQHKNLSPAQSYWLKRLERETAHG